MLWVAGSVLVAYTITYSEELCIPRNMVYAEQSIAGAMYMLFPPIYECCMAEPMCTYLTSTSFYFKQLKKNVEQKKSWQNRDSLQV